jgi:type III secretory pathway lipoprotein EscJ
VELRPESESNNKPVTVIVKSISDVKMEPPRKVNWIKRFLQKRVDGLTRRQVYICVIFAFVEFFAGKQ